LEKLKDLIEINFFSFSKEKKRKEKKRKEKKGKPQNLFEKVLKIFLILEETYKHP